MSFDPGINEAIIKASRNHLLPISLIEGITIVESNGKVFAVRYEPTYPYLFDVVEKKPLHWPAGMPTLGFPHFPESTAETELVLQRCSLGPMQVMGATARELGLKGWLTQLLSPLGIDYGAMYLAQLKSRFHSQHGWPGVIAAYNAGQPKRAADGQFINQQYVDRVYVWFDA